MRNNFESEAVSREFGYDNTGSFHKAVKRVTGKGWKEIKNEARGETGNGGAEETEEHLSALQAAANAQGFNPDDVNVYWVKSDEISALVKRPQADIKTYENVRDETIEEMKKWSPRVPLIHTEDHNHLLVVDPADIHVNKLCDVNETGYTYNIETAVNRAVGAVSRLAKKASVFGLDRILLIVGNDVLNSDGSSGATTGGTKQTDDGTWYNAFQAAKKMYISMIEELSTYSKVDIVFCASNHDNVSGWMLVDTIQSWFHNNENVSFGHDNKSISMIHRKYYQYGSNLIGVTHADCCKEKDLPGLMQYEARQAWSTTRYGYWYLHHRHHKDSKVYTPYGNRQREKDHVGVTVMKTSGSYNPGMAVHTEVVRSPSPADGWHHRSAYLNECAIEVFLHHVDGGQVARFTEYA